MTGDWNEIPNHHSRITIHQKMTIKKFNYEDVPQFSKRDIAYIQEAEALRPFFKYSVSLESFRQVIEDKKKDKIDRDTLVKVLRRQHAKNPHPLVQANIAKLALENTFTVVTAHQPSLFTGPLYYIFKNISAINLAEKLTEAYPEYHFVPIFLTGGEDHDFEEVNHLHLFHKTLKWESGESGPVGAMKTATLAPVLEELKEILGESERAKELFQLIEKTYTTHEKYGDAAVALARELFKEYGLVVFNPIHIELKKSFRSIIREEIMEQPSHGLVNEAHEALEKAGFSSQAHAREINFFYLGDQYRERIVEENGVFKVLNTDLEFSAEEMEAEIENHPERFSPNVIMRPLFQETTLPNVAYIGGGGEIAYWLERKKQFEHFGVNFPMLIRRNSAMWVDKGSAKRLNKLGLSLEELWGETEQLIKDFVAKNSEKEFTLEEEKKALEVIFEKAAEKTKAIDPTLEKAILAEHAKARKGLENMETRLIRAEKQRFDQSISQLRSLQEKLFPGGGLQERYDNFIPFYLKYGKEFFEVLKASFDPLEKKFVAIADE